MTAVPANATSLQTKQAPWWLGLMAGILNIVLGIMLLTIPVKTVLALVWVLGIYWVIQGIFTLVGMFVDRTAWGWKLFSGLLSIIAGIVVVRHPIASAVAMPVILMWILGIQGIIVGLIALVMAFRGGGILSAILGVLSVVFGVIILLNATSPAMIVTFVWVVGIFAIVGGIAGIFQAFRNRAA
ncbi:MAG: DUF308 domain-containing protein [Anaerolineae bacterium]|jgi:uncharacterized membrane protein HdeD (DUF308 family)|nr:DUF308 domain-containing protein [Anaerolineae bacterium]